MWCDLTCVDEGFWGARPFVNKWQASSRSVPYKSRLPIPEFQRGGLWGAATSDPDQSCLFSSSELKAITLNRFSIWVYACMLSCGCRADAVRMSQDVCGCLRMAGGRLDKITSRHIWFKCFTVYLHYPVLYETRTRLFCLSKLKLTHANRLMWSWRRSNSKRKAFHARQVCFTHL